MKIMKNPVDIINIKSNSKMNDTPPYSSIFFFLKTENLG